MIYSGKKSTFSVTGMIDMERKLSDPEFCRGYVENNVEANNIALNVSSLSEEEIAMVARAVYDKYLLTEIKINNGLH